MVGVYIIILIFNAVFFIIGYLLGDYNRKVKEQHKENIYFDMGGLCVPKIDDTTMGTDFSEEE